ncbi:MAG: DUF1800 family protein [Acidobacteriota bacterium]
MAHETLKTSRQSSEASGDSRLDRRLFLQGTGALGVTLGLGSIATAPVAASGPTPLTTRQRASRFLAQSTFGGDTALIDVVEAVGPAAWLETQMAMPRQTFLGDVLELMDSMPDLLIYFFDWVWWKHVLTQPDVVRHRVTFALSQILVVGRQPEEIFEDSRASAAYWDVLAEHAFGNFKDLLLAITLQPSMGIYLSHLYNRRGDASINRFPDENFAREVMQLFSIGLFELEPDGSHKLDADGDSIPTYGNEQITEMAKIFTGLALDEEFPGQGIQWGDRGLQTRHLPMVMYEPEHEPGPKTLLNGFVVPAGQTGMQDIEMAIDHLFHHPNVGPFLGTHLIKFLVTSNPSPAYVARVSAAFADNGSGVRGDMKAVIRAILLDTEARDLANLQDPRFGKVREPLVRWVQLGRAFHATSPSGEYRHFSAAQTEPVPILPEVESIFMAQFPLTAPSVFNFFSPIHQPTGPLADAGLVAPEMEIIHAYTSIATDNAIDRATFGQHYLQDYDPDNIIPLDLTTEIGIAQTDPETLIDHLDLILTYGTLTDATRTIIRDAILPLSATPDEQVRLALYLFMICPEYAVLR